MGRPLQFAERLLIKLTEGTKAAIREVADPDEDTVTFIRQAIEREIARRKRRK